MVASLRSATALREPDLTEPWRRRARPQPPVRKSEASRMTVPTVFAYCVEAIRQGDLIERVSRTDKEYHFQNWFRTRLEKKGLYFEVGGRNSYPDFRMVATTDGYELKGLAYPG